MRALAIIAAATLAQAVPAAPFTPGTAAMLVNRTDPEYRVLLRQAITDPDPAVRAVGARVAAVRHQADMAAFLKEALDREHDLVASAEQSRALGLLASAPSTAADTGLSASEPPTVRTVPIIVRGLLASLLEATGCRATKSGSYGIAHLWFDGNRVPTRSEVDPSGLAAPCHAVLSTMTRLTTADDEPSTVPVAGEYLLLPIDAEYVACTSTPISGDVPMAGGNIAAPRLIHHVAPEYPAGAMRRRQEGAVIVTATITSTGCVQVARITKGLEPSLDLAALRAVTAWRFEPARLAGNPVPVMMTVTVNFKMR